MGDHLHLLVKMIPEYHFTDEDIQKRFESYYGESREFSVGQIPYWRENCPVFPNSCGKSR